jgi:hypothetical protein
MKSILLLITAALLCAACADERPAEAAAPAARTPVSTAEPATQLASPGDVTTDPSAVLAAPATPDAPSAAPARSPARPAAAAAPRPEARRITPDELRPMLDAGEAILVDVRGEMDFAFRHAEGAVHIPAPELFARSVELPHEKLIALYCT